MRQDIVEEIIVKLVGASDNIVIGPDGAQRQTQAQNHPVDGAHREFWQ